MSNPDRLLGQNDHTLHRLRIRRVNLTRPGPCQILAQLGHRLSQIPGTCHWHYLAQAAHSVELGLRFSYSVRVENTYRPVS